MGKWLEAYKNLSQHAVKQRVESSGKSEANEARRLLQEHGWCAVRSAILDEVVIWTRDGNVVTPDRWKANVHYTLEELGVLANNANLSEDGLRRVHEAKRIFKGTIVRASADTIENDDHARADFPALPHGGTL